MICACLSRNLLLIPVTFVPPATEDTCLPLILVPSVPTYNCFHQGRGPGGNGCTHAGTLMLALAPSHKGGKGSCCRDEP